jgi:hypothetical protein
MAKDNVITLLAALVFAGPISGSMSVVCYGHNGRITVEPLIHDHCDCPAPDAAGRGAGSGEPGTEPSTAHAHCEDVPAMPGAFTAVDKGGQPKTAKAVSKGLCRKPVPDNTVFSRRFPFSQSIDFPAFFAPLRTVILLA